MHWFVAGSHHLHHVTSVDVPSCLTTLTTVLLHPPALAAVQPVIMAGALYFGALPKLVAFLGLHSVGASLAAVQSSLSGLLFYGLLIFLLEFVPFGGINPKETSDYLIQAS